MNEKLKFYKGNESALPDIIPESGSLYHCKDTGNTYLANENGELEIYSNTFTFSAAEADATVLANADLLGGYPANEYALKVGVGQDLMDLEDYIRTELNGKAPAGYGLGKNIGVIPANSMATFVFSQSRHSALFSVRGNNGVACGNFLLNGYGAGGANRTMVKRLVGGDAILYGIVPQGNGTGITIWNNSGAEVQVNVLVLLGSMPTMTVGSDGGATAEPFEYENPPMVIGQEYRTTERWNNKAVYVRISNLGALPNSSQIEVNTGITFTEFVELKVYAKNVTNTIPFPLFGTGGTLLAECWRTNSAIYVKSYGDVTGYSGYAILKYTKD